MAALTAALLGLSAAASYAQTRKQGEYEAHQYDVNAGLADAEAEDALLRGKETSARLARDTQGLIGSQRVALAGQGIAVDSGSAADIQSDTAAMSELDRLQIEHNAQRAAWGIKVDAANNRARAEQTRSSSRSAARTTLLTAASQLYAMKPTKPESLASDSSLPLPGYQQTYNANNKIASNDYSGLKIRQPRRPR